MEPVDYKAAGFWLDVVQWLSIGLLAIWGYLRTKDGDNARAVAKVADEMALFIKSTNEANEAQNMRLTALEEACRHMPTAHDVSRLDARVGGLSDLLQRMEHQITLIHQHLLTNK